ncbi:unnamed protein product [Closterium sp. Naga37s-1]|nr:unnamed protein product [Closterium sp. Naga37s-1]
MGNSRCPVNLELRWQAEVSSSIYSTPLVADINRDGKMEVVVPSFVHYLEVLDGYDGDRLHGWPAFYRSSTHTSPLLYDIDKDGVREIILADYNGEILSFTPGGEELTRYKMSVPRLRIRKEWYVGLDPDHVDHAHPDIHAPIDDAKNASSQLQGGDLLNLPTAHAADAHAERGAGGSDTHAPGTPGQAQGQQAQGQYKIQPLQQQPQEVHHEHHPEQHPDKHPEQQHAAGGGGLPHGSDLQQPGIPHAAADTAFGTATAARTLAEQQHPQAQAQVKVEGPQEEPGLPPLVTATGAAAGGAAGGSAGAGGRGAALADVVDCGKDELCSKEAHAAAEAKAAAAAVAAAMSGGIAAAAGGQQGQQGQQQAGQGQQQVKGSGKVQATEADLQKIQSWEKWHQDVTAKGGGAMGEKEQALWKHYQDWKSKLLLPGDNSPPAAAAAAAAGGGGGGVHGARRRLLQVHEEKAGVGGARRRLLQVHGDHHAGDHEDNKSGVGEARRRLRQVLRDSHAGNHEDGPTVELDIELDEEGLDSWDAFKGEAMMITLGLSGIVISPFPPPLCAYPCSFSGRLSNQVPTAEPDSELDEEGTESWDVFKDDDDDDYRQAFPTAEPDSELDEEGADSWDVFKDDDDYKQWEGDGDDWAGNNEGEGEAAGEGEELGGEEHEGHGGWGHHGEEETHKEEHIKKEEGEDDEWGGPRAEKEDGDEYQYDYDDYVNENMWEDEDWTEAEHEADKEFILVDSHILCTPVIADIDNDGHDELVVAASHFFDREYYEDPAHKHELEEGVDMSKYIGGAIVVFDLHTQQVKWSQHLDLTTDSTQFRAYIYSAPTVVDLDGDGFLEIIVGTSVGFIYCLDAFGKVKPGFPLQMGEVQGQVVAADVNHDGKLEIIAADTRGNVAAFSSEGKEVWERHLASLIAQGASVGDVNGDGFTEVVIGSSSGHIYVLDGRTGKDVGGFPFRTHGRIMAPILLVDLHKHAGGKGQHAGASAGLHLVVVSFDGFLYAVDGRTGCADTFDIGETSYSMVLAENVDGGDDLDLVVSTMNGAVYCFQTSVQYHPLKAWPSQNQGRNVFFPRYGHEGIYMLPHSRQYRDIGKDSFRVSFEIVDARNPLGHGGAHIGPYKVKVWLFDEAKRELTHEETFQHAGVHTLVIPTPKRRTHATFFIEMEDERRLHFHDEFALSFHIHFYRLLKWILALPLLIMAAALIARSAPDSGPDLPSFSPASRHLA